MAEFIEQFDTDEWEVETPSGWESFTGIGKTVEYKEWVLTTNTGKSLVCADNHILIDSNNNQVFAKNLSIGDSIQTKDGNEEVFSIVETDNASNMYDLLNVANGNVYYTNDILSHNSTTIAAYILHYILFNKNKTVGILANKKDTAVEILSRVKLAYQHLPKFIQQGVIEWNKGSCVLENGSRVLAAATSSSSIRGYSFSYVFIDEVAHIPRLVWDEFYKSTYPTISSGKETKLTLVSTPNGLNQFYKIWTDAEEGRNDFVTHKVSWDQVPGRDAKWREETIRNTSEQDFAQEHDCSFIGSSNTLIATWKLKQLAYREPIYRKDGLQVFYKPRPDGVYTMACDVAEGVGGDYSTFTVIDISHPEGYKIAALYRNNKISTLLFPDIIHKVGTEYNSAYVLVETNSIGREVVNVLHNEFEYENILMTTTGGRAGQTISSEFGTKGKMGVKTTNPVRRIGCSTLKTLIEENKLQIEAYDLINELAVFTFHHGKYQADVGYWDDLVMTLVLFAWMTQQSYFRDLLDINVRKDLYADKIKQIEQELLPFGFIDDGITDQDDSSWKKADFLQF